MDGSCSGGVSSTKPSQSTMTTTPIGQPTAPPSTITSSTKSQTTSPTTSSSTTSSASASVAPTVVPSAGNFLNQGCFYASTTGILIADNQTDSEMTVAKCVEFASNSAWQFAGLEGNTCRVGNTLHNISTALVDQQSCSLPCSGATDEICGGSGQHLQVSHLTR